MLRRHVIGGLTALVLTGCAGQDTLSREKAEEILKASFQFRADSIATRQVGQLYERFQLASSVDDPLYSTLRQLGWISLNPSQKPGMVVGLPLKGFDVSLTDEGKAQALAEGWPRYGDQLDVVLARKRLVGVTGVRQEANGKAIVQYRYEWSPTTVGMRLKDALASPKYAGTERYSLLYSYTLEWRGEQEGKGSFSRFDDGWRLD